MNKTKVKKKTAYLDASDYRRIEQMKRDGVLFKRPDGVKSKPSLESSAVWLASKLDSPISVELPLYNNVMHWYNFLKQNFSEEFHHPLKESVGGKKPGGKTK